MNFSAMRATSLHMKIFALSLFNPVQRLRSALISSAPIQPLIWTMF